MNIKEKFLGKQWTLAGFFGLLFLLAISYFIRSYEFSAVTGAANLEATYHVLLTTKALKADSPKNHWFLPTVSLGSEADKKISWGATVPTKNGDYIYTSFAPPGFLGPYFAFNILHVEPSEHALAKFNFTLGALVSFLLYFLLVNALLASGTDERVAVGGAVLGTLVSIFSKEVLQSHGVVYWVHSLYQVILISSLLILFAYLRSESENSRKRLFNCLLIAIFVGAWTEWTGYVFGLGLAAFFWFGAWGERSQRIASLKVTLSLAAAGLVTLIHYGIAVGFLVAIEAFLGRFLARGTSSGNLVVLLSGYALSFGLFIVVIFVLAICSFFSKGGNKGTLLNNRLLFLFAVASIPVAENLIMMQHAGQYSFDRLKLVFPIAIIVAIAFANYAKLSRVMLAVSLVFASIHGYKAYKDDMSYYSSWAKIDEKNKGLVKALAQLNDIECSVLVSDLNVRGYSNLLFNRGIYEGRSRTDSVALLQSTNSCSAVFINGSMVFPGLPYYRGASVFGRDGTVRSLEAFDIDPANMAFFLTDSNWTAGVAKHWAGFFVPNAEKIRDQLNGAKFVVLGNGEVRRILEVRASGEYLNVSVHGPILDPANAKSPDSYFVLSIFSE